MRLVGAACLAVAATACGHAMFAPPSTPGIATDATAPWAAATSDCRSAQSYIAALKVSGRAGAQPIRGLAIETAVTPDRIYMSATVSGQSIFLLAGAASEATLWLRREQRVVKAPAGEIIDAILGLSVPPDRLLALLTGCITRKFDVTSAVSHGALLEIQTSDARVFLRNQSAAWRPYAGETEGFLVELLWKTGTVPEKLWLRSKPGREPRASLDVTVIDPALNQQPPAGIFSAPAGAAAAQPMTLQELRTSPPWGKS